MEILAKIKYTKLAQIGAAEGLNSAVFRATDPQLDGEIVVKEISQAELRKLGRAPTSFFDEAKLMYKSKHKNVVPIYYACETTDNVCLAMPLYAKGSLQGRIACGPLPLSQVLNLAQGVLAGVAFIHSKNLLHLDIKPSNIFYSDVGDPMVADFGQARAIDPTTGVVTFPRMYHYAMPPEVLTNGTATVSSDVYQIGLLLYRAVNGNPHYKAQVPSGDPTSDITCGAFPDRQRFLPHVPKRLKRIIRKALALDPADRYASAMDLADDVGKVEVSHDWQTVIATNGATTWTSKREGQATIGLELIPRGSKWSVKSFTERDGKPRRARASSQSEDDVPYSRALASLKRMFEELSA